ncbi:hypothetical protein [Tropicimonas marinistellae]|uniref:hypothetical protein n=1 Tax=Tropicimonas marinistellae TaxID=1739787 RepID=UPI00082F07CB|nr:hypothetical protein [Tropicimonas marinistellae]
MLDGAIVARGLHVLGVVLWIGGVAFVTTVLLPAVARMKDPEDRVAFFEEIERAFAWQARGTTLLVGLSGFYLVGIWDLWDRFAQVSYFWMHAMVAVWAVFTVMLFVAEPLFLHRWFLTRSKRDPEGTFRLIQRMHRILLAVSLLTVIAAVAGTHGGFLG